VRTRGRGGGRCRGRMMIAGDSQPPPLTQARPARARVSAQRARVSAQRARVSAQRARVSVLP